MKYSIIVDSHNDTMMKCIDEETWLPKIDIGKSTDNHIDIPKLKKGRLNVPFFAAFTDGYHDNTPRSISRTLALINALHWTEENNKDEFKIVGSVDDILRTVDEEKIAAVPTIEGGYSFDENNALELIKQYYDLGIRAVAFNWNYSNSLGEGASRIYNDPKETPSHGGLTDLGKTLVYEMNRLGIIIDVSHMAESTFWDVISATKAPIMASHSGVYALRNHPRNLKDEQLRALKDNGGVIGIVLCQAFLTDGTPAYIKDYVDHIDYAVKLIGIDHVGIGSDFDGATIPEDIKDASELYKINDELIRRGYSKEDIEKLLGKNILRVLDQVEKMAEKKRELDIDIVPNINTLTGKIKGLDGVTIDESKVRIIIDGNPYKAIYDKENSTLSLKITEPLQEKFHVVSFQVEDDKGNTKRETRIFYI